MSRLHLPSKFSQFLNADVDVIIIHLMPTHATLISLLLGRRQTQAVEILSEVVDLIRSLLNYATVKEYENW